MAGNLRLGAILLLTAMLALAACNRTRVDEKPPEAGDRAVATVDEHTIWASDVKRAAVAEKFISEGEPLDVSSPLFRRVLDQVIDDRLLAMEARKRKLDEDASAKRLLEAAEERILGKLLVEKQVEKAVTDSAVNALYQEHLKLSSQTDEYKARQIVTATLAEAEAVKRMAAAGQAFETLAAQRSIDGQTRYAGGEIPGYFTADVMPEYALALKDAKPGQVLGPFQTEAGFVLLKILDRRPEQPLSLEAVKPQIVRLLTYDEVRDLIETVRRTAKVKVLIPEPQEAAGALREPDSAPPAPGALPTPAPGPAPKIAPKVGPPAKAATKP